MVQRSAGYGNESSTEFSAFPVRYADGVVRFQDADLESDGFSGGWGRTRTWTNGAGYAAVSNNGSGMVIAEEPHLVPFNEGNSIAVVLNGSTAIFFDLVSGSWVPRAFHQETLTDSGGYFKLTDTVGNQLTWSD